MGTNNEELKATSMTKYCTPLAFRIDNAAEPAFGLPSMVKLLQLGREGHQNSNNVVQQPAATVYGVGSLGFMTATGH